MDYIDTEYLQIFSKNTYMYTKYVKIVDICRGVINISKFGRSIFFLMFQFLVCSEKKRKRQ